MVDVKQDISEDSKQVVRVKRELKIAPLNPSPVKKNRLGCAQRRFNRENTCLSGSAVGRKRIGRLFAQA